MILERPAIYLLKGNTMPDFRDLESYINAVRRETNKRQEDDELRLQEEANEKQKELQRRERARLMGLQAAHILKSHNIPTVPIWSKVKVGQTAPQIHTSRFGSHTYPEPVHALQKTQDGWKLMTRRAWEGRDDIYGYPAVHYSLDSDGVLQTYHRTSVRNYKPSFYSEAHDTDGIIEPSDIPTHELEPLVNGERFKKGIASLIAGLGEYEF